MDSKLRIFLLIFGVVVLEAIALSRIKVSSSDPIAFVLWIFMLVLLALVVKDDAIANVNAIWCGMSAVIVTLYAAWSLSEKPKLLTLLGIGTVVGGVTLIEFA